MNVWCVNTSDKVESIRTLFLATIRAVSASGGILCACVPDVFDDQTSSTEKLKLLCKAGAGITGSETDCNITHLLETVHKRLIPNESVYKLETLGIGDTILILCKHI